MRKLRFEVPSLRVDIPLPQTLSSEYAHYFHPGPMMLRRRVGPRGQGMRRHWCRLKFARCTTTLSFWAARPDPDRISICRPQLEKDF